MENNEQKGNILFKKLDLVFVYLFVFLVGVAIVLGMTSFLNDKVKEFTEEAIAMNTQRQLIYLFFFLKMQYNYIGDRMKVTILGTGAYGLALSKILVENINEVVMWTTFEDEKNELLETKKSPKLKGFKLDDNVIITTDLEESIRNSKLIV